jgi:hypothetical protein
VYFRTYGPRNSVRPWLVVVGIIFLTLAIGTAATIYFAGQGNPSRSTVPFAVTLPLLPNESETLSPPGSNGSSEQFLLTWHSSVPIELTLESPAGCAKLAGPCWSTSILESWDASTSGYWIGSGPFHYPLQCLLKNPQNVSATVTVSTSATSTNPTHLSLLIEIVLGAGAAGLFVVGGLAVFLGLFLRADPYGPEPPVVPRSADDVEELYPGPPPDH